MSAAHLLHELRTLGVKVWPDAGALRFKAPASAMTPELTARLKVAKPALLALLSRELIDTEPVQDLPLLAACVEFEALIERLCNARSYGGEVRVLMHYTRCHMSPDRLRAELPLVRDSVLQAEQEAKARKHLRGEA